MAKDTPQTPVGNGTNWATIDRMLGPVRWDWPGWLPRGFLILLASEPGTGKSLLCLRLAATYLHRLPWPDGRPFDGQTGQVLWCESEAGHALNLERARQWGLDLSQIINPLDSPLHNFKMDNELHSLALYKHAKRPEVRLVILDSLRGLHSKSGSIFAAVDTLVKLADIARVIDKPILLTHHLRKRNHHDQDGKVSLDQLRGSAMLTQPARVVWTLDAPDPADSTNRRLAVIKNNLAPFPSPLGVKVETDGLHFGPAPQPPTSPNELERAMIFLQHLLAAQPLPFIQIEAAYQAAALSGPTIRRAKKLLGVQSIKLPNKAEWHWTLPSKI